MKEQAYEVGGHKRAITVRPAEDETQYGGPAAEPMVAWSSLGAVDLETAENFLAALRDAIAYAKGLESSR